MAEPKVESSEAIQTQDLEKQVAQLNQQLASMRPAAMTAETNELTLHRRLSPYLDAEIGNRDVEIEDLQQKLEAARSEIVMLTKSLEGKELKESMEAEEAGEAGGE